MDKEYYINVPSNDAFALGGLIGKLGGGGVSDATSFNPPAKLKFPILDRGGSLGNSLPPVHSLACDPGFAESFKANNEMNLKKRKAVKSSSKENSTKTDDDGGTEKRSNDQSEQQKKQKADDDDKTKDYIHVRARRGQATDSHSLAERVRREKISERMKLLQDLVPGCNKVSGKALMLDEIINYVQSLQRQVEFLSMKLASVNPGMDVNMNNILSKDLFEETGTLQQQLYLVDDTSSPAFYHQNGQQPLHNNASVTVDPMGIQFPSLNGFSEFPVLGEDDLHSIVRMGSTQNPVDFPVADQSTDVTIEL